ncbi:MAG: hypothetical protein LKE43_04595 [Olsenella sp.]|nr:hypothetical protein [Olsenella sp.]
MVEQSFEVEDEKVTLRATEQPASTADTWTRVPVICLHVFEGDGADVWQRLREGGRPAMALVAIAPKSWDSDLTPWPCPPVFRGGKPYEGAAAAQLDLLEREIIPQAEALLAQHGMVPSFSALAGYSLAGLFAAWAATQSGRLRARGKRLRLAVVSGLRQIHRRQQTKAYRTARVLLAWRCRAAHAQPRDAECARGYPAGGGEVRAVRRDYTL